MNYSEEFYEQMRKDECLFILSDQSKPMVYHLYLAENNPEKNTLCKWIVKINLCYNPGTEPKRIKTCPTCMDLYQEYAKERSQKEAREILPTILSRKRKPSSDTEKGSSGDGNIQKTKWEVVKITDERYPDMSRMRYRCTNCTSGISDVRCEPCSICSRAFHPVCKQKMASDFYHLTKCRIPKNTCVFCTIYLSCNQHIRTVLLRTFRAY